MATAKKIETLTTREVAEAMGTTPRELRVFLRASKDYEACGAGARYTFVAGDLAGMKAKFMTWTKERAAKAAEADAK
ncbi:hypothetical protein [Rhodococcus sp. 1168]|uniref:hypothetical protein n=1 Tax=Rhodococcus sp. 1168 TaxID=2018041 RepID=UPI000A0D1A85|nr:hypothetical protein [Rhodococcus sp. 1168]ORI17040.1 hypothetical protein BJI47_00805 [Rhodococcus sp. 1168]